MPSRGNVFSDFRITSGEIKLNFKGQNSGCPFVNVPYNKQMLLILVGFAFDGYGSENFNTARDLLLRFNNRAYIVECQDVHRL